MAVEEEEGGGFIYFSDAAHGSKFASLFFCQLKYIYFFLQL